jgi:hypothetical protein
MRQDLSGRRTSMQGNALGTFARGAKWGMAVVFALFISCGDDSEPRDTGGDEDSYFPCTETMCTEGHIVCCAEARPGTWDSMRLGCVCPPPPADADADGDGDVTPDDTADVEPDVEPDVEADGTADVEPDATPDGSPDVAPDVEPDGTPEASFDTAGG